MSALPWLQVLAVCIRFMELEDSRKEHFGIFVEDVDDTVRCVACEVYTRDQIVLFDVNALLCNHLAAELCSSCP